MKEFIAHYLMEKPAPEWHKNGVPLLKMQEHIDACLKQREDQKKKAEPVATPAKKLAGAYRLTAAGGYTLD